MWARESHLAHLSWSQHTLPSHIQTLALSGKDTPAILRPCQVRTLQPFSWGLQPAGHFEIVYMPGRPQHFLPPQSSRGSSRDGEVVKVGVTSVDYVDSFTISGSCRVLINADLQGCTAFAKFSEMGQCFKLQLLLPPHPEFSLCPQGCPQTHQPPLWVEVLHSGNTRTYFWLF